LDQSCNIGCDCGSKFDPVCGSNDVLYFSPCHAGCRQELGDIAWNYGDCSCITNDTITMLGGGSARKGRCASDDACKHWQLYPFLILFALIVVPMLSITAPAMQATLRCVPSRLTSVAVGLQLTVSRSLGAVPGPPIFGAVVDSVCLVSQTTSKDEENACAIYDQKNLGLLMFFIAAAVKILSFLFILAAWLLYRSNMNKDKETKEDLNANNCEEEIDCNTKL